MDAINVLFVIIQMELGGSEQLVLNIIRNLDRKRFSPSVAWFKGEDVLEEFSELDIPLFYVPKAKRFDFNAMRYFANILAENNIHVVNAHHFMPMVYAFYGCKIKRHSKLVYTEHSEWEVKGVPRRWQIIGTVLMRFIDRTVGVSPAIADCLQEKFYIKPSKCTAIENGIDLKLFSAARNDVKLKEQLGIEPNEILVGIVANLKRVKNHLFLLAAFKEIMSELNNVTLLIIGQGFKNDPENTEKEIKNFIDANNLGGKILLLGYRSDIPELLSMMDIFCLTSDMEGLPISLIEAMGAGVPVVGTDVPGIKDVIEHGVNGYLIPQNETEALKAALFELICDDSLRVVMGGRAQKTARAYSLEFCVKKYESLFVEFSG